MKKLISIQLLEKDWITLRARAKQSRRSIKGQAEWELLHALTGCTLSKPLAQAPEREPDPDPALENIDDDPPEALDTVAESIRKQQVERAMNWK